MNLRKSLVVGGSARDPRGNAFTQINSLTNMNLTVKQGVVQCSYPLVGQYWVASDSIYICTVALPSSGFGAGPLGHGSYNVGDTVVIAVDQSLQIGLILGAVSSDFHFREQRGCISEAADISMLKDKNVETALIGGFFSGCTGDESDSTLSYIFTTDLNPLDSFGLGMTYSTRDGIMLSLNPSMAVFQASSCTGIELFSDDEFMRISGRNVQRLEGGRVTESYLDYNECYQYSGSSFFSWEPLGLTEAAPYWDSENNSILWDDTLPENGSETVFEPKDFMAKPFHRVIEYGGYVGQGVQRSVLAPPDSKVSLKYGASVDDQLCLSRISQFSDGFIGIESAKGISLSKRCFIPYPQQMYPVDDMDNNISDGINNTLPKAYKFDPDAIPLKPGPAPTEEERSLVQSIMALNDYHAYIFNYQLVNVMAHHVQDYKVMEESAYKYSVEGDDYEDSNPDYESEPGIWIPRPDYSQWYSDLSQRLAPRDPESLEVDIQSNFVSKYYASESGFALLPEGGVSLYGGYGEELRMAAGSTTIASPGDISIRAGRDIHLWAGGEVVIKGRKNIEASSSTGNVRIKSENLLEILGGNGLSAEGGVLIESKSRQREYDFSQSGDAVKFGGLILRATNGIAAIEGKDIFVKAGVHTGTESPDYPGAIVIDAGSKFGVIRAVANTIDSYVTSGFNVVMGTYDTESESKVSSVFSINAMNDMCSVDVKGRFYASDSLTVLGDINSGGRVCATGPYLTTTLNTFVSPMGVDGSTKYLTYLDGITTYLDKQVDTMQAAHGAWTSNWYSSGKIGNIDIIGATEFSYRTESELSGYFDSDIYADRWQNIAYTLGLGTSWEETKVLTSTGKGQYPYPGDSSYSGYNVLVYQPHVLYNQALDMYSDRFKDGEPTEHYKDPKYAEPLRVPLNEYRVI